MSIFRDIIHSGLSNTDIYQKKRAVIFSNYISLILCGAVLQSFIIRKLAFWNIPYGIDINFVFFGLILFISPILLNRLLLTTSSRLFLCFAPVIFLWFLYLSQMREIAFVETSIYDSLRIHLLAVSFIPYLLFDKRKPLTLFIGIMPTFLSFIFFEYILYLSGESISQRGILGNDYQIMQHRTIVAYIVISGSGYAFHSIIIRNDTYIQKILSELKKKSDEIELQNKELLQSQSKLNEANQHLEILVEKKTESIKRQNDELKKYAFSNAHHVRGPLARILGLIQMYKIESSLNSAWFFEKVEYETKEIDKIIQRIAADLDSVDHLSIDDKEKESHISSDK